MSDVTISIDANTAAAEAKARRLKDALDGTGRSWAKAASESLSRVGGEAGGGLGRMLGGVAGGFSLIAAAAAAAGIGLNAYLAASARAVENAREQVSWQQRLADAMKRAGDAQAGVEAGGLSQARLTRRLLARGGTEGGVQRLERMGFERGDALDAAGTLRLGDQATGAERWAALLAKTGEMSLAEAAKAVGGHRGRMTDQAAARMLVSARGQQLTPAALNAAQADLGRVSLDGLDPISQAVQAGNAVADRQGAALMSGDAAQAVRDQARRTLDPRSEALSTLREEVAKTEQQLRAAANAQGKIAAALATLGRVMGGEGSALEALNRYQQNTAAVRQ